MRVVVALILIGDGSPDYGRRRHGCGADSNAVPGPVAARITVMKLRSPDTVTRVTATNMRMAHRVDALR